MPRCMFDFTVDFIFYKKAMILVLTRDNIQCIRFRCAIKFQFELTSCPVSDNAFTVELCQQCFGQHIYFTSSKCYGLAFAKLTKTNFNSEISINYKQKCKRISCDWESIWIRTFVTLFNANLLDSHNTRISYNIESLKLIEFGPSF